MCKWTYNEGTLKLGNLVNTGAFTLKDLLVVYHRHEYCRFNPFLGYCCRDRCTTYPDDLSMLLSYTTNNKKKKRMTESEHCVYIVHCSKAKKYLSLWGWYEDIINNKYSLCETQSQQYRVQPWFNSPDVLLHCACNGERRCVTNSQMKIYSCTSIATLGLP